eukprot:SAG11_NODE_4682_length_1807_cov_3.334895_1_plen_504_part_01
MAARFDVVAFDMDQCAVAAHSHGRLPRAEAASFAGQASPDFVRAVEALAGLEKPLGLAIATHSDLAQHSAAKPREGPKAVILGEELARAVLYAAVPAHAHHFLVVGWNPRARGSKGVETDAGKRVHLRTIAAHYGVALSRCVLFDNDPTNCATAEGFTAFKSDPAVGFRLADYVEEAAGGGGETAQEVEAKPEPDPETVPEPEEPEPEPEPDGGRIGEGPLKGLTAAEVAGCIATLHAVRADLAGFTTAPKGSAGAAECRAVRKELMPLVERLSKTLYGGKKPEEYKGQRWLKKKDAGERAAAKAADARRVNGTALRNARLMALHRLQGEQPDGLGDGLPMIPDGTGQLGAGGTELAGLRPAADAAADAAAAVAAGAGLFAEFYGSGGGGAGPGQATPVAAAAPLLADAGATGATGAVDRAADEEETEWLPEELEFERVCYCCKARYKRLHKFYDQLCPACAALNWKKRHAADRSAVRTTWPCLLSPLQEHSACRAQAERHPAY